MDLCIDSSDPSFASMLIDEAITASCRDEAARYRQYELDHPTPRPVGGAVGGRRPASPRTPSPGQHRLIQPMCLPGISDVGGRDGASSAEEREGTDSGDQYVMSPTGTAMESASEPSPRFRNVWTHANAPRSMPRMKEDDDEQHSPKSVMKAFRNKKAKRHFADFEEMGPGFPLGSAYSSPSQSPKRGKLGFGAKAMASMRMDGQGERDGGYEADTDGDEMELDNSGSGARPCDGKVEFSKEKVFTDLDAARTLVNFNQKASLYRRNTN